MLFPCLSYSVTGGGKLHNSFFRYFFYVFPFLRCIEETRGTQTPIRIEHILRQNFTIRRKGVYWPIDKTSIVSGWQNIYCGIETCPGYMPGCYVQAVNLIYIGDYTQIAANVGLISANHNPYDLRCHEKGPGIRIGAYSWIGMNSVILPDVELGEFTIVGAGAVVTKSFKDGYCVIAGNPARMIKELDRTKCVKYHRDNPYYGFLRGVAFEAYRKKYLNV